MATSRFILSVDPKAPPPGLAGAVVAIGNFDGVHRGHRAVIFRAKALAQKLGRPCAVLTFEPHPADFFAGVPTIFRLTSRDAKAHRLRELGLDGMVVLSFDAGLAALDAENFLEDILLRRLGAAGVVVGYDFHFGAKRSGTPDFLRRRGAELGLFVEIVEKVTADEEGSIEAVSSTAIREALIAGDVETAAALQGHPWSVTGEVVHGAKLGRTLGYPTANLALDQNCGLRHAIYAVGVELDGALLKGVASFGRRPTVEDNGPPLLEIHIFDFDGDLYGREIEVYFIAFLRPEEHFPSLDALMEQIRRDEAEARRILDAHDQNLSRNFAPPLR
ncbi:bifunctional riboflavin kinase/FAD synthetase [Rhodoblastus acidophilus]|uniref:Riboflavin biosynthesis protein n=1 Tax=Rhodoblastus acidophilus TaxID=1074 RepID=A0A6N8DGX4_RHOAC|nr:bifunctional riboflavin kinase/FAD synthetase [Rhodoblastus acidophilus]MCW2272534.1 riboflavin kinase/FMN adenylyltransferase [Rhodoblastus acidophilus]MTV29449.1 bifunctional riboflavin kinase/FAD synthetase [Rhodoblastus acidophilus]